MVPLLRKVRQASRVFHPHPKCMECARTSFSTRTIPISFWGPIQKQRWIYSCCKQMLDRVIWAYGQQKGVVVYAFQAVQLDRPAPGQPRVGSHRQFQGDYPVDFESRGGNAHQADRRRASEKMLYGLERRRRMPLSRHREQKQCFATVEFSTLAIRTTRPASRTWRQPWSRNSTHIRCDKNFRRSRGFCKVESRTYYGDGYQDMGHRKPSIEKARRLLGWKPTVKLEQSVEETPRLLFAESGVRNRIGKRGI